MIKIAGNHAGKHFMALTNQYQVYSWGNGDCGRLGHGDNSHKDEPTLIEAFTDKNMINIECGVDYRYKIIKIQKIATKTQFFLILVLLYLQLAFCIRGDGDVV